MLPAISLHSVVVQELLAGAIDERRVPSPRSWPVRWPAAMPSRPKQTVTPRPVRAGSSKYAGMRIVPTREYQAGGNPRRPSSHGYNAYELIPLGDRGIRFEDLLAAIRKLPAKSSPTYGAGGTNHIKWDLDHGFTYLIPDA